MKKFEEMKYRRPSLDKIKKDFPELNLTLAIFSLKKLQIPINLEFLYLKK